MNKEHIDGLIAKYFAGEALPDEAILLEDWKSASPQNLIYFNECRKALQVVETRIDTQALFANILQQAETQKNPKNQIIPSKRFFSPLRIAASLLLISLLGILATVYVNHDVSLPDVMIASNDTIKETKLADGTRVSLNKNTKLTLAGEFNGKERSIKLEGEAFFEVIHNDAKPFVVDAGGIWIKDVGTAFNVKAETESDSVYVSVTEGIVDMSNATSSLRLAANESALFIRSSNRLVKLSQVNANINSYHTKMFSFKAGTLREVINALNAVYGNIIELDNNKLAACRITVDFNNDSPETIVAVITETLGLKYQKNKNGIFIIYGSSCIQ